MSLNEDIRLNKNIKITLLNIYKDFNKEIDLLNESINKKLNYIQSQSDLSSRENYIYSLEREIAYYKINIKNTEHILSQWIEGKNIPNKEHLQEILINIEEKSKQHVKNIKLNDDISKEKKNYEERKEKLEKEFIILNIYLEVLKKFIYVMIDKNLFVYTNGDSKEEMNLIKTEIRKCIISLVKSIEKLTPNENDANINEDKREHEVKDLDECDSVEEENTIKSLNPLEEMFLNYIKNMNSDLFIKKMDIEYRKLCSESEIKYSDAYGFGEIIIRDYIGALVLMDICKEKEKQIICEGIRLVINGTFSPVNFREFIEYIISMKLNISEAVWQEGISYIEENRPNYLNHSLSKKQFSSNSCDNICNYIYKIENKVSNLKSEQNENTNSINTEENPNLNRNYPKSNKEESKVNKFKFTKKKKIIIGTIIALVLCAIAIPSYLCYKEKTGIEKATNKLYEVTDVDKAYVKFNYSPDDNCITDQKIKHNYYIFKQFAIRYGQSEDFNYLVNKKDFNVYYYEGQHSLMFPFKDYIDSSTLVGMFVSDYYTNYYINDYDSSDTTMEFPNLISTYIEENGSEAFYKKLKEIMDDANSNTVEYYGAVYYVSLILGGYTKNELDNSFISETGY